MSQTEIPTRESIQSLVTSYTERMADDKLFFPPAIPPKKLANAITAYAPEVKTSDVLLLADNTVWGSAKDGALLTYDRFYMHNMWETPVSFSLEEIKSVAVDTEPLASKLHINEEAKVDLGCVQDVSIAQLARLLDSLAMLFNPVSEALDFSEPSWIDELFDPGRGWEIDPELLPVNKVRNREGQPIYVVNVDGIEQSVFEITEWDDPAAELDINPHRVVMATILEGLTVTDPKALLKYNATTNGLPSLAISEIGELFLECALPVSPDFPLDIARRQMMVCMGLIAKSAHAILGATQEATAGEKGNGKGALTDVGMFLLSALFDLDVGSE